MSASLQDLGPRGSAWVRVGPRQCPRQCPRWCGLWARMGPRGSAPVPVSVQDLGLGSSVCALVCGFVPVSASVHVGFGPGRFENCVLFWEGDR